MFNLLTFYLTNSWISMQNFLLNKSVRAFIAKYYWHEFQCRISKFDEKLFTQRWYNKTSLFLNARKNYAQNGGSNSTPRILTLLNLLRLWLAKSNWYTYACVFFPTGRQVSWRVRVWRTRFCPFSEALHWSPCLQGGKSCRAGGM